jgi:hypothetical protein
MYMLQRVRAITLDGRGLEICIPCSWRCRVRALVSHVGIFHATMGFRDWGPQVFLIKANK